MYGGRQFLFGLALGGLGLAFIQTQEGKQLLKQVANAFVNMQKTEKDKEISDGNSRKVDEDSGTCA